jgi:uncharacterized protein
VCLKKKPHLYFIGTQMNNILIADHIAEALTDKNLRLIIFPTEKCNLRCTYCYEDFSVGRMPINVVRGLKNLITRRADKLHQLELAWFGGEPLLASDIILDLCEHAQAISKKYTDLHYVSTMTTNGTLLTVPLAQKLSLVGVKSYQISLDGPSQLHDQSRVTVKNKGTYAVIWKNLCDLAKTKIDFEIILRVHYQIETWQKLLPLIRDINAEFGHDARFKVFFKSIVRLGGSNDSQITKISHSKNQEILSVLYGQLVCKNQQIVSWVRENYVCYAAKSNSFVVRSNGALNKCTVALNDERNVVGKINSDGTLAISRDKLIPWLRGVETQVAFELACPYTSHMKSLSSSKLIDVIEEH